MAYPIAALRQPAWRRAIALELMKLLKLPVVMTLGEFWCLEAIGSGGMTSRIFECHSCEGQEMLARFFSIR